MRRAQSHGDQPEIPVVFKVLLNIDDWLFSRHHLK
jgi:hypothetical protein